jgi:NADH-quinone oxidoreductase subunit M
MFSGLFKYSIWYAGFAGLSIILAAVYTLSMIQKVFYGETNVLTSVIKDISWNEKIALGIIVVLIFVVGLHPQPFFDLANGSVTAIMTWVK